MYHEQSTVVSEVHPPLSLPLSSFWAVLPKAIPLWPESQMEHMRAQQSRLLLCHFDTCLTGCVRFRLMQQSQL
jgi:hypothetical protein